MVVSPLIKPMALGLIIGVVVGSAGLIGLSMALDQDLFGIRWRNPETYYVKITLYYIYLHIHSPPRDTPLIGNKTLLEYIVIVRVQNPYKDLVVVPHRLDVDLCSYVEVKGTTGEDSSNRSSGDGDILFDAWRERALASYSGVDNILLDGGVLVIDGDDVNNWLFGGKGVGSRKYYVVSGVVEIPLGWMDKFSGDRLQLYAVVEFSGRTQHGEHGVLGQIIQRVHLSRVGDNTYVYNSIGWRGGFELRGSQIETFYGGIWP